MLSLTNAVRIEKQIVSGIIDIHVKIFINLGVPSPIISNTIVPANKTARDTAPITAPVTGLTANLRPRQAPRRDPKAPECTEGRTEALLFE